MAPRKIITMGLDLSLSATGIVCLNADGAVFFSMTYGYSLKVKASAEDRIKRLDDISYRITFFVQEMRPDVIGIEDFAYAKKFQQAQLGELHGAVKVSLLREFKKIPEIVGIQRARKEVLGYGGSTKKEIEKRLVHLSTWLKDDNQRDAYVVAEYCRRI